MNPGNFPISPNDLIVVSALFYLLGFATPLIVMRGLVRDREDGCALNFLLLAIATMLVFLILIMIIR